MSILTDLHNTLSKVVNFFTSTKAKQALSTAAELVTVALPIVQQINVLVPNKTVAQVIAAYSKYGVPVAAVALNTTSTPTDLNNALLNLATSVLAKNLPAGKAVATTSILQTAVQLAVLAAK